MKDAVDILNDQLTAGQRLNAEIGRLRQRESMLEAQVEVLELTINELRCVCDAAFTVVREDDDHDWTAWQTLVCALEDVGYQPCGQPWIIPAQNGDRHVC